MKIKREVSFIELMYMYYKGDVGKGQYYSTNSQFIVVITVDDISFYNALYPNKSITITIPNDTKFIVEAVIDASTELSSIVVTYKQGNSVLNSVWYRISINEVIDYYVEGKNTWLLSVSTVVDNELVTIWKDGNVL
ncbi:intron-encoded nuclease [Staphylococcus phage vB_SauM_Remus]|uniref:Intron-encoded nuclease n=5 Tax=Silviavirus remus TaxID=1857890 RepID=A0A8E5NS60_9CAUD|nr:intron-encoded nuclease [Staphylococcus phage vB_SauM_Romulus]YP_008431240.1 intron-encoded nuclease [Staphylococcus phage vB_SauM_Remus]QVD57555.1 intron-encoded nuclease [Staphylococcus phage PM56]QVD58448.1 intron-encoded nuclease [Staphylococcus phage PM93]QVD58651.1 intron-encoded nuclease [Silviavirus remus]QVD58842.1 intron-encoded nuclease [Staphylococcus phage Romulus]AFV81000.1 intron-encoded nuclease [Staphylococcus phage vB_SauM_Remus]